MQSSVSTTIAMWLAVVLIVILPMVTLMGRMDNVAQEEADKIVEEFVTDVANTGILTREKYENLASELNTIGVDDIQMEIYVLDENPGKKTAQANYTKIGENVYLIKYNTQILPEIGIKVGEETVSQNDTMLLGEGYIVSVEAKSTDSTAYQTATSSIFGFSNADEYAIFTSYSRMVTTNGMKK